MALEVETAVSLEDLKTRVHLDSQLVCAILAGQESSYGLPYEFVFSKFPTGFFLRIDSLTKEEFQKMVTEEQAEENIKSLANRIREITGGYYDIHPFMGALWNSDNNPIIPGFGEGSHIDRLCMIIHLRDDGDDFDMQEMFTQVALNADTWIKGDDVMTFFQSIERSDKVNPNGSNRDQAIANDLGMLWDQEFHRYNDGPKPTAMQITHSSLYTFADKLTELSIRNLTLKGLTYEK